MKLAIAIVKDNYHSDIRSIIEKANISGEHLFVINNSFDVDYSSEYKHVVNISKEHHGIIEGYNQIIDYVLGLDGDFTHILFIDEHAVLAKDFFKHMVDEITGHHLEQEINNTVFTTYLFDEKKDKHYSYSTNKSSFLDYRKQVINHKIGAKQTKFNNLFFLVPIDILKECRLPSYLYSFIGCNYSFVFNSNVMTLDTVSCHNIPYELKMNQSDLYYYFRNSMLVAKLFKKDNLLSTISKKVKEEVIADMMFYRYNDAKATLLGTMDYLRGAEFLSKVDLETLDVSLNRLNYYLWTPNELDTFFTWRVWETTREPIGFFEKRKNIKNNGYIDEKASDHSVIDMYNQIPFSTFNTKKILSWDMDGNVGFVTRKNETEIKWCLKKLDAILSGLENKQGITSDDYIINEGNKPVCYYHKLHESDSSYLDSVIKTREEYSQKYLAKQLDKKILLSVGTRLGFCDNPKYILLELLKRQPQCEIVWAAHKPELCDEIKDLGQIKIINIHDTELFLDELYTSKVVIYDDNLPIEFVPKKDQILINTWHGGVNYKNIGLNGERFLEEADKELFMLSNPKPTYFIAGSEFFLEDTAKAFNYPKEVFVKTGLPRNDVLINHSKNIGETIKKKLGIEKDTKICLYAPTFRNDNVASIHNLDVKRLLTILTTRFGGNWKLLYRGHTFTVNFWTDQGFLDVTNYPDQQEILLITDVLISDYSSMMWDASLLGIPTFTYSPDFYQYLKFERGFAYEISKFPFKIAKNNDELETAISSFNEVEFKKKIDAHFKDAKTYDKGNASKQVVDIILPYIK